MNIQAVLEQDMRYVGVNDHEVDLFEGQYIVPNGMAYNSYVILDEKIAVLDTVDAAFGDAWLSNVEAALNGRQPDYLIVHHMEPDHAANIDRFMEKYPAAIAVASQKAFGMMQQFFGTDYASRRLVAAEGTKLPLGQRTLTFIAAPMVHWPEVLLSFEETSGTLFSADAFGKFGALDIEEDWACEARRYYMGIVGKYGLPVQTLLKKAAKLSIRRICPLHGPVLTENLGYYINLYDIWSSYKPENEGVLIAYTSVYGHTKAAARLLAEKLEEKGCPKVVLTDLARSDMAEAVEDAFRYDRLVLASPTYNGDVFPFTGDFIHRLIERSYQNRTVAFMENGSWAPTAAKVMGNMLAGCKNLTFAQTTVRILSALNDQSRSQIDALAEELCQKA